MINGSRNMKMNQRTSEILVFMVEGLGFRVYYLGFRV